MKTSSCKAKGRNFQKEVRDILREIGGPYGLVADDIKSTSMGVSGVDVQLSPAAKLRFSDMAVECKNVESLNVVSTFIDHASKYPDRLALLFHKKNRTAPMVTMSVLDFQMIFECYVKQRLELLNERS